MDQIGGYPAYNSRSFLGVDKTLLEVFLGVPYVSFPYKGNEIYIYEEAGINTFEIKDGVVVKSNAVPDRRKAYRVVPGRQVKAKLRFQDVELTGHLQDISTAGAAVTVAAANRARLDSGATAFLKCSLPVPTDKVPCEFVIKGTIYHIAAGNDKERVILVFPPWEHSPQYQLLSRYILLRQVEMFLKRTCV